jgi:hypothetical protein
VKKRERGGEILFIQSVGWLNGRSLVVYEEIYFASFKLDEEFVVGGW